LLAALVAAGSAARLVAQGDALPVPAVDVSAPRAVEAQQMPLSPFAVVPDAMQSAGFRSSLTSTAPPETPPVSGTPSGASAASDKAGSTTPPASTSPHLPAMDGLPSFPTAPPVPSAAPAWRWHGYGAVITGDNLPPTAPAVPTGSAVSALPAGPDVSQGTDGKQPGAAPAFTQSPDGAPAAMPASAVAPQPLSANEPRHQATGEQVAAVNPMSTDSERWVSMARPAATPIMTVSATVPVFHGPVVTLDPPRAIVGPTSRTVGDPPILAAPIAMPPLPPIQPVAYSTPAPRPTTIPSSIRSEIERVCAVRGHDLDVSTRGPSSLMVKLKVRQAADAEYLANAISRLPDLAPYQVQFQMQVAH
jgi:hypothetical protein